MPARSPVTETTIDWDDHDPEIAATDELSQSGRDEARRATSAVAGEGSHPRATIDEYERVRPLGSGGMGKVYEYRDTKLERPVAIKFVREHSRQRAARLLDEARAAAMITHPNVAAIYRVSEIDGVPFIVSEYIKGSSLDRKKPIQPWRRALEIAMDLARGLAEAHRHGVVHGDIKPANAMVDARGTAKLIDFGLARRTAESAESSNASIASDTELSEVQTRPGRVYGTPAYMAPEIAHGEETTQRSDVYAFGVMLYELCTGRTPAPHEDALASLDAGLARIVRTCLARDPEQRYASAESLLEALEALDRPAAPFEGNPYRSLRPFEAEHRALFFGRSAEIWQVLERLRGDRLVILAGGSGVGKSSLARAGVLPQVAGSGLGDGRTWQACTMVPGTRPVVSLGQALAARLDADEADLIAELGAGDLVTLRRRLRTLHGHRTGTVLLVDQLEELVTLASAEDAAIVGQALASLIVEQTPGLRVLATARLDHVARLAHVPGLGALVQGAVHIVGPLGRDAVRDSIIKPARATGVRFESDALVDELASTTAHAEGALPLLQFTLTRLWEQRDEERNVITREALDELGGVEGALAQHADTVLQGLLSARRSAARDLLVRMVTLDRTRARVPRHELEDGDEARHEALETLVKERLVVTGEMDGEPVCEIAHEALITAWPTLRRWLDEEGGTRAIRARLGHAAGEWQRMGREPEGLWGPRQLNDARALDGAVRGGQLSGLERAFLRASQRAVARARWLRRLAFATPVLVAAAVYGVVWVVQSRDLDSKVQREIAAARSSLADAHEALAAFRAARDGAIAELGRNDAHTGLIPGEASKRAERAWTSALDHERTAELAFRNASTSLERALGLDPRRESTRALVAQVLDERAAFAHERYLFDDQADFVERLELYDRERHASWIAPVAVRVDTTPSGAEVVIEAAPAGAASSRSAPTRLRAPFEEALDPGSYVLIVQADDDHVEVRYPLYLPPRSSAVDIAIARPRKTQPAAVQGLVHVPAGHFLFGYGGGRAGEGLRPFFETVPIHPRQTGAFWIARHETTYAEWIEFLNACWPDRCAGIVPVLPAAKDVNQGYRIELVRTAHGEWELEVQPEPDQEILRARTGQPLVYTARRGAAREQDWLELPVTGVTREDIQEYLDWLAGADKPGTLPGARLCREDEWERAARGADARIYPHGDGLRADQANIDITYDRAPGAYGADEVGSHEHSVSPFGLHDMTGNVWEMTISIFEEHNPARIRGGSYYQDQHSAAVVNRWVVPPNYKDTRTGFRLCVSAESK